MNQNPTAATFLLWIKQPAGIHTSDPEGGDATDGAVEGLDLPAMLARHREHAARLVAG